MSTQSRQQIVFVVDDEVIISATLGMILRHEGYDSRSFDQPDEAIMAAHVDSPDLLVTDLIMPGMTGIELANRVRQTCPRCRVLVFSGQASMSALIERGKEDGIPIDHFLLKPVHPMVLLRKVEDIMNGESMASA
jgi:FixJ family two-component response regulator